MTGLERLSDADPPLASILDLDDRTGSVIRDVDRDDAERRGLDRRRLRRRE